MSQGNIWPGRLYEVLEALDMASDRAERIQMLIALGDDFDDVSVPSEIARRPFDEARRVPACESEAFVFTKARNDGALDYYFAVENPQGVSARALAVVLGRSLGGVAPSEVARVDPDLVYALFGRELSMGKSMGLMGMVTAVKEAARAAVRNHEKADAGETERSGGVAARRS